MRWYLSERRAGVKEQAIYKQTNGQEVLELSGKKKGITAGQEKEDLQKEMIGEITLCFL
jgi:hypothetical protein